MSAADKPLRSRNGFSTHLNGFLNAPQKFFLRLLNAPQPLLNTSQRTSTASQRSTRRPQASLPCILQAAARAAPADSTTGQQHATPVLLAIGCVGHQVGALLVQRRGVLPAIPCLQGMQHKHPGTSGRCTEAGAVACKGAGARRRPVAFPAAEMQRRAPRGRRAPPSGWRSALRSRRSGR